MRQTRSPMANAARTLQRNGLAGTGATLPVLAQTPPFLQTQLSFSPVPGWLAFALCLITLTLSAHLLLDGALFRLGASYATDDAGLAAIDATLARIKLRTRRDPTRGLTERLAGCQRLLWRQRIALAATLALFAASLIDTLKGAGA